MLPTADLSTITSFLSHFIIYPSLPFFIPRHNERKRFCNRLKVSPLVPVYLPPFLPGRGQWRYNGDITPMNRDIIQWRVQSTAQPGQRRSRVIVYNCPRISRAFLVSEIRPRGELLSGSGITRRQQSLHCSVLSVLSLQPRPFYEFTPK